MFRHETLTFSSGYEPINIWFEYYLVRYDINDVLFLK